MPIKGNKSFVDDKKVSDHHAIIPTEESALLEHLSNEERKIYDLVVRRFISVLYPAFEYEQTTLKGAASGQCFIARGKRVLTPGWKAVYETDNFEEDEEEQVFRLVTSIRGNSMKNLISIESPLGKALLHHRVGDTVTVPVSDSYRYEVVIREIRQEDGEDGDSIRAF